MTANLAPTSSNHTEFLLELGECLAGNTTRDQFGHALVQASRYARLEVIALYCIDAANQIAPLCAACDSQFEWADEDPVEQTAGELFPPMSMPAEIPKALRRQLKALAPWLNDDKNYRGMLLDSCPRTDDNTRYLFVVADTGVCAGDQLLIDLGELFASAAATQINMRESKRSVERLTEILDFSDALYGTWHARHGWGNHNQGFERLGYDRQIDLVAPTENNPMHPDDWHHAYDLFQEALKTGRGYEHDWRAIDKNGDIHWYHANVTVTERNGDGTARQLTSISRNITNIVAAEQHRREQAELERWIVQRSNALFRCNNFDEITVELGEIARYMGLLRLTVRLVDPKTLIDSLVAEWHEPHLQPLSELFPETISRTGVGWMKRLVELGEAYVVDNTSTDVPNGKLRNYYNLLGCGAIITQPMIFENKLTGGLNLMHEQPYHWTARDKRVAKVVSETLHMTILKNRLLDQLRTSEERFQLAMECATYGLWDHDVENDTIYLSPYFYKPLGYEPGELEPTPELIMELAHPDDREHLFNKTRNQYFSRSGVIDVEFRQRKKDGSYLWVLTRGKVVKRGDDGRPLRVMGVNIDISEHRNALAELQRARESAEEANRSKSEFLERMSHEIRTPMNAVLGLTYLTLEDKLTPDQRNYLEDIDSAAKSLLHVIDDILDFSRIESGELKIVYQRFDIREELQRIIKLMTLRAEQAENKLEFSIGDDVPRHVVGDKNRLGQILTNLLSNAVKFTRRGTVSLAVQCADIDSRINSISLLFSVSDSGIGLSREQIDTLFEPFTQADGSTTRKYGGSGLGLSICKHLVEMMGGSIHVVSLPEVGTTFHFTIVFKQQGDGDEVGEQSSLSPELTQLPGQWAQHKKVLLVEDNVVNQRVAKGILDKFGIDVETADNGEEALRLLAEGGADTFDAIFMDVEMPVLDGLATARRIRGESRFQHLPIIAMTAHAMVGDRERCLEAGMNDHVPKPVNPLKLQQVLARIWR